MAEVRDQEDRRLRRLVRSYRLLTYLLVKAGSEYTDEIDCCFCSGFDDYKPAGESRSGTVKHSRKCPIRKAEKLGAVEV